MPFKTETAPRGALEGVRILDIATMAAGPWAATYLADWGADVIKVEHRRTTCHCSGNRSRATSATSR
jgi:crotonobetainyl-CoA:carnitine CoA-transferase CaiB-like acyl-CoA transferase